MVSTVSAAEQCWALCEVLCPRTDVPEKDKVPVLRTDHAGVLPHLLVTDQFTQCLVLDVKIFHCTEEFQLLREVTYKFCLLQFFVCLC